MKLKKRYGHSNKEKWIHSACAMCTAAPMKVKVRAGKVIDVKGENIPGWNGELCGKAISGIADRVYPPDRILSPLKRIGKRGEGKFTECSWEEVIDALATKLKQCQKEGHSEAFDLWWGCPHQQDNMFFLYYWSAVLETDISYLHGQICFGDHNVEKILTFGKNHATETLLGVADWLRTKYAVIAAQNFPGTGNNHGGTCSIPMYHLANKARENGCKFVIIDPKLSDSAAWCDEWIPIKPGGDDIFALTIANILIKENLFDEDFLLKFTNAPQLIREDNNQAIKDKKGRYLVWDSISNSGKPISEAGKRDGLSLGLNKAFEVNLDGETIKCNTVFRLFASKIKSFVPEKYNFPKKAIEVARELGKNKPSVIFYPGFTSGRYPNWFHTMRIYSIVNLLLGNFEKPGGIYFLKNKFNLGVGWPEPPEVPEYRKGKKFVSGAQGNIARIANIDKNICYTKNREYHPDTCSLPWLHFQAIEKGKVKAVLSSAENSAITQTNTKWVRECLKKLDLIVVGDQFGKEFIDLADYVIPEASFLERFNLYQHNYLTVNDKEASLIFMRSAVIPPQGNSKPLSWFLIEVAKKIGKGKYFEKLDLDYQWWDRMLKNAGIYPKVTAKKLVNKGPYVEEHSIKYDLLFKPITTRSGRFEIFSNELAEECYYNFQSKWHNNLHVYPLPIHLSIVEPREDNEFFLICGKASWHQKSATQHNPYLMEDALEGGCPYMPLYLNKSRAEKLGIADGDLVEVECVGPTKKEDKCVINQKAIGIKARVKVKLTEALHPEAAWIYFASGRKSNQMASKTKEGIAMNWFIPSSVTPYSAGLGKNYSIIKINKLGK